MRPGARLGAGLTLGDHACWRYADDGAHRAVLTAYFRDGVAAGEKLAYFGRRGSEHKIVDYLADHYDVDTLVERGQLLVGAAEDAYAPGGEFDADARIRSYEALVAQALAEGYPGLRVFGDVGWLAPVVDVRRWCEYEFRADLLADRLPFVALCGYDVREWTGGSLALVDAVHRGALDGGDGASLFHLHGASAGVVSLSGEVDFAAADLVRQLLVASGRDVPPSVIDLSALSFVDGAGASAVFRAARSLPGVDLLDPPPVFRRIWDALGYDEVLPVATTGVRGAG